MADKCENGLFNNRAPLILIVLNVLLILLMGIVGFMAKDLYTQVRSYPNTEIRKDVEGIYAELDKKADRKNVNSIIEEVRVQYDRLYNEMIRQNNKLDEMNVYLRDTAGDE